MQPAPVSSALPAFERQGPISLLRLRRPRHHNRLQPEDITTLSQYLDTIAADPGCRVLILTADGASFSAGYDLGALRDTPPDAGTSTPFAELVDQLEILPQPTLCALNGSVYGGATDLALACDFRLGVVGMRLRMPAARLGIHYYAGGLRRFVERLGLNAAKRLFLAAEDLEATELLRIGYLDWLLEPERLMPETLALAEQLAANAPRAVRAMKQALNGLADGRFDARALDRAHLQSLRGDEAREGLAAWHERRPPRFTPD